MAKLYKQSELNEFDPGRARKEYQRLKRIATQRIGRLDRNDMLSYIEDLPGLPSSKGMNNTELYQALAEVNRFLKNPFTLVNTVRGFENNMIKAFHSAGYKFVNKGNIRQINKALGEMKKEVGDKSFDSDEAIEFLEEVERLNISYDDFFKNIKKYMNLDPDKLQEIKPIKTGRAMKFGDVQKRIRDYDRKTRR